MLFICVSKIFQFLSFNFSRIYFAHNFLYRSYQICQLCQMKFLLVQDIKGTKFFYIHCVFFCIYPEDPEDRNAVFGHNSSRRSLRAFFFFYEYFFSFRTYLLHFPSLLSFSDTARHF